MAGSTVSDLDLLWMWRGPISVGLWILRGPNRIGLWIDMGGPIRIGSGVGVQINLDLVAGMGQEQ